MEFLVFFSIIFGSIFSILIFYFVILPLFVGAPFDITHRKELRKMIKFSKIRKGDKVVDLGSGDGRVVIEFAKLKDVKEVHGFEINPFLVYISRRRIKKLGLQKKAFIHWKDFWNINLSEYNVVIVFQVIFVMGKLENKLKRELKKDSRVISNTWKFPNWKLKKREGKVYLYEI